MSNKNKLSEQDEFQIQKMKYYKDKYKQLNKTRKVIPQWVVAILI